MRQIRNLFGIMCLISLCSFNGGDKDKNKDHDKRGDKDDWGTQHPNGNNGGGNKAPIDGGISILLAAGLGLGAKKIYDHHKKTKAKKDVI